MKIQKTFLNEIDLCTFKIILMRLTCISTDNLMTLNCEVNKTESLVLKLMMKIEFIVWQKQEKQLSWEWELRDYATGVTHV